MDVTYRGSARALVTCLVENTDCGALRQDIDAAGIEPWGHPVAVVLDLVQPCVPVGCLLNQRTKLW
jgi:hypothetical protein